MYMEFPNVSQVQVSKSKKMELTEVYIYIQGVLCIFLPQISVVTEKKVYMKHLRPLYLTYNAP